MRNDRLVRAYLQVVMPSGIPSELDSRIPPFDRLRNIHRLAPARSGHASVEHVRHQLFVARDQGSRTNVLVKMASKPGLVYQQNLLNEIASLTTINRELPDSRYFPFVQADGRLPDGRVFLIMSLFDELPLAAAIAAEHVPARIVGALMAAIEVARALADLHRIGIRHVDLNPMNILYRTERGRPVIRIVDFESSYDVARHASGETYIPSTTPGYSAPEVAGQPPDGRADEYSLGAVLYTMLAGYEWTLGSDAATAVGQDPDLEPELRSVLLTAVAKDPADRYQTIGEFRSVLVAYLEGIWPGRSW
jgi:serine/threonine protein kinase